jgi:hypothetical protein
MARPPIQVGDGVKVYIWPVCGREDATCTQINNQSGVASARTVQTNKLYRNLPYWSDGNDGESYWTELPPGYVPGSEGH